MKKEITAISIHQTSKVVASVFALLVAVFVSLPFAIFSFMQGDIALGLTTLILLPFIYWIIFYIVHAICFAFYNFVAKHLGGMQFEVKEEKSLREEKKDSFPL